MADQNSTERQQRADQIEADAIAAEVAKHEKATRVAEGLQRTRAARDEVRRGKKR